MSSKNKDLNAARLEKAIIKKYGEEAIKNPKSEWDDKKEEEYLGQLKKEYKRIKKLDDNKLVINSERECPICQIYSFELKDDLYMNKFGCCYMCFINHIEGREERWKEGWRPNKAGDK